MEAGTRKTRFSEEDRVLPPPHRLGQVSYKRLSSQSSPATREDTGGTEQKVVWGWTMKWGAPGQSVQLGSDGIAQCSCDLVPPFTGLNVMGDLEGGASAAKSGLCPPGQEPSPLWDCLLIGIMQDIGNFSGP